MRDDVARGKQSSSDFISGILRGLISFGGRGDSVELCLVATPHADQSDSRFRAFIVDSGIPCWL